MCSNSWACLGPAPSNSCYLQTKEVYISQCQQWTWYPPKLFIPQFTSPVTWSHIGLPLKDSPKELKVFCWKFIYLKATAKIYGYPVKSHTSLIVWPQLSCWQVILLKIRKTQCYFLDPMRAKWMHLSVLEFMYKYFTFLLNSLFPLSSNKKENGII